MKKDRINFKLVNILLIVSIVCLLYLIRDLWIGIVAKIIGMLFPFILAFAIAYALYPFVKKLMNAGFPKWLSVGLVVFILIGFLSLILILVVPMLYDQVVLFLSNISRRNNQFQGRNFINNLPFFIFLYFTIFYVLQLCGLMIDNKLYESYMTMICTIFKEVGKYLNILLLIAVYHSFNKYIKETDFTYDNKHNQNENNKVYKDDEAEEIN